MCYIRRLCTFKLLRYVDSLTLRLTQILVPLLSVPLDNVEVFMDRVGQLELHRGQFWSSPAYA